ncbi:hypothetical protein G7Y79_00031g066290 [Physcia stellaris]|nr:hypothetical protein G7Y79_00031g066290 [Physcia stellaris]
MATTSYPAAAESGDGTPFDLGEEMSDEERTRIDLALGDSEDTSYGSLDGETVLVEYHDYEIDRRTGSMDDRISGRIMRLVALMHEASDARFKVMKCTSYIDDKFSKKFGFVFTLPQPLNACPNTLLKYLSCRPSLRPNLTAGVELAHTLAETVQLLHSVGWVHKSLRSEKILFLRAAEPERGSTANSKPRTESLDLHHPRIFGFEFSRLESDNTSLSPDLEIRRNIYRHPDRWGYPKQAFSKVHDIYAFGVILLEIGLWESIESLDKGKLLSDAHPDPVESKRVLMKHANLTLGFRAGERYQQIVLKCLDGGFEATESNDTIGSKLQLRFMKEVVDALQDAKFPRNAIVLMLIHLQVPIDVPFSVGSVSKGTPLSVVPMKNVILKSEPGFEPAIDAEIVGSANDYIHNDPDGKHMRLNAHGLVKDKSTGGLVYINYTGVVGITPGVVSILSGKEDAKTTEFGNAFIEMRFETGEEKLKGLELGTFVGSGRFLVDEGKLVTVEYKLSKVVKG